MEVKVKLGKTSVDGWINLAHDHLIIASGVKLDDTININGKVFNVVDFYEDKRDKLLRINVAGATSKKKENTDGNESTQGWNINKPCW